jgi:divalent metal cation (Fe/Co/Zn/Cd) transporter
VPSSLLLSLRHTHRHLDANPTLDLVRPTPTHCIRHLERTPTPTASAADRRHLRQDAMPPSGSSNLALAAVLANTALAIAKLIAAAVSGSAVILAEAIHSIAAATSHALLLVGLVRVTRAASLPHPRRPMGELRFWTTVVPILLYSLGAGVAINEGIDQLQHPRALRDATTGYVLLAVALLVQAGLAHRAWRQLCVRPDAGYAAATAVSLETRAAITSLIAAVAGLSLSHGVGWTAADGLAAIVIGLVMGFVAALMALETKALIRDGCEATRAAVPADPASHSSAVTHRKPEKGKRKGR